MISGQAIRDFLNRDLDQFDWVKGLPPSQIDSVLQEWMPTSLTNGLWAHQKMMLMIMQHQKRFMIFAEMGGGKSRTILTQLRHRKLKGENPKALVFVPYLTAVDTWISETEKWAPELTCCPLLGTSIENLNTLKNETADIFPFCYQSAVVAFTRKVYDDKKGKNKLIVDPTLVHEIIQGFDTLILDEVHRTQNSKSQTFKLCNLISQKTEYAYGLTGTPFGNDFQSLWAEFYLIDFGATLSPNIDFYRTVFFNKKAGFWGGVEYNFKKKLTSKLQTIIKNRSIHFSVDEMVDLPSKQYIPIHLNIHGSMKEYVNKALKELKEAIIDKNYGLIKSKFVVLRQASSGFITVKSDEDEERIKSEFSENPKLDALCNLIEDLPLDTKAVVFHDYVYSNELISKRLTKLKVGHARIWGAQKDPLNELKRFREDPNCRVLVINSKSGSSALNLQFASYVIFYECPAVIDRSQAEARCWRPGQTKKVFIYDLLVKSTLDEEYYDTVREGGDLLKQFLSGKKSKIKL